MTLLLASRAHAQTANATVPGTAYVPEPIADEDSASTGTRRSPEPLVRLAYPRMYLAASFFVGFGVLSGGPEGGYAGGELAGGVQLSPWLSVGGRGSYTDAGTFGTGAVGANVGFSFSSFFTLSPGLAVNITAYTLQPNVAIAAPLDITFFAGSRASAPHAYRYGFQITLRGEPNLGIGPLGVAFGGGAFLLLGFGVR